MVSKTLLEVIEKIRVDLARFYPKTVVLFGSAARFMCGVQEQAPQDIDLLYVGSIRPIKNEKYPIDHDFFFFEEHEIVSIARSLRYQPKALSRAKMYFKDSWNGYVRSDIASCLLLGASYASYGFLQMENEEEFRDYSIHNVLLGESWWCALQAFAQDYRGIKGLGVDKILGADRFAGPPKQSH